MWEGITPRWILLLLPWEQVAAGKYRVNRVEEPAKVQAELELAADLPESFADYYDDAQQIELAAVETTVQSYARVEDLYSYPFNQLQEQLRIAIQGIKERKEYTLFNSPDFGLLKVASPKMRIPTISGPPTPDDMDNLLSLVWKMPAFFVAHPRAIAAFGRQCNALGINLDTVEMFGVPFVTWRGVPIVPSDKIPVTAREPKDTKAKKAAANETSSILLMRVGEQHQGVVGLHQAGVGDENFQSLVVRYMGINQQGVSSYLVTCYFAAAVLAEDALGVLENVSLQ
ncbi:MAG: hypothetical protein M3416_01800 [Acidobacteriota bacterium]|nr:hypothetical protein [Acidobacteriota bacterium]